MAKTSLFLIVPIFCIYLLPLTQGLDCYQCVYAKAFENFPIPGELPFHKDCDKKDVPDRYKVTCDGDDICGKAKGEIEKSDIVVRGCVPKGPTNCNSGTVESLLNQLFPEYSIDVPDNLKSIKLDFCRCDKDKCNDAFKASMGWKFVFASVAFSLINFLIKL